MFHLSWFIVEPFDFCHILTSFLPPSFPSFRMSFPVHHSFLPPFIPSTSSLPSFLYSLYFLPPSLSFVLLATSSIPPFLPSSPLTSFPSTPNRHLSDPHTSYFCFSFCSHLFPPKKTLVQPMPSFIFYFLFFLKLCLVEIKTYLCHDVEVPVHRSGSSLSAPTSWFWRAARVFATLR